MKIEIDNTDWASARTQEAVRAHFANAPTVELEFSKQGRRTVSVTAKTEHILSGQFNQLIDANAAKGFSVAVSAGSHEKRQETAQHQQHSHENSISYGF